MKLSLLKQIRFAYFFSNSKTVILNARERSRDPTASPQDRPCCILCKPVLFEYIRVLFLALSMLALALNANANTISKTFSSKKLKKLYIKNSIGTCDIIGQKSEIASYQIDKKKWGKSCELEINEKDDLLSLVIKHKSLFSYSSDCEANILVKIPSKTTINMKSGSGDVKIIGMVEDLELKVGSGSLKVEKSTTPNLILKSGSGNVSVESELEKVDIKLGSGNIKLAYLNIPKKESASLKTGSGNITILLPKESEINSVYKTGSGNFDNEFKNSLGGYKISVKSGSGNIYLKKK